MQPHEVIVIDSGSTDETLTIAKRYPVVLLEMTPEKWSYPRALNIAATHATGEILVCLSAHSIPWDGEWLARLVAHFDDERVAAVWGQELNPSRIRPTAGEIVRQTKGLYKAENRSWGMSNANSALRRSLWVELPFDEQLPAAEDKAWAKAMIDRGWTIVYEPEAVTLHARHSPLRAYRRNRAVMQGYHMIFPEIARPSAGTIRRLSAEMRGIARERHRGSSIRLGSYLKHVVTVAAHLLGGFVGSGPFILRHLPRNSRATLQSRPPGVE